jgi:predicted alpha/beta-fold hydrolase
MAPVGMVLFGLGCGTMPKVKLSPVSPIGTTGVLSPREYAARLSREIPQKPKPLAPFVASFVYEFPWLGTIRDSRPETAGTRGGYHRLGDYEIVEVPVSDGLELVGRASVVEGSVPWVILVHGALRSGAQKHIFDQAAVFQRAGFGVLSLDMREHGLSWKKTAFTGSLGWREGLDLVHAAEWLRATRNAEHVSIVGTSLGGRYALRAAIEVAPVDSPPVDAVIAIVPAADLPAAAGDLQKSTKDLFGINAILWRSAIRNRDRRSAKATGARSNKDWAERPPYHAQNVILDYIENVVVPRWGFDSIETWKAKSDPVQGLAEVPIPVLIYAVRDDPFVRLWQTEDVLMPATEGNPNVGFVIADKGGHTAFALVDTHFFYNVTVNFLKAFGTGRSSLSPGNQDASSDVHG